MRKRIVSSAESRQRAAPNDGWLDLREIATVEVTSEDVLFPIETVFGPDGGNGWKAARAGDQLIRLVFDTPIEIKRIRLCFREPENERTQEFSLKCLAAGGGESEVVRQQWNFNPRNSVVELEDYSVDLARVAGLELTIRPNIGTTDSFATLAEWRLGSSN